MTKEERAKIYEALAAPFPENCIERTDGHITGKGYSTTGIKCQHIVNRLNEVLGVGGWRTERTVSVKEITTARGRPAFEAICAIKIELGEWQDDKFVTFAEALGDGGHMSISEADARKGAFTNALKKGAALFGCGKAAYEGTLDDDNVPNDEPIEYVPTQRASETVNARPNAKSPTRSPRAQPQTEAEHGKPAPQSLPSRRRLSSRQLAAIWKIVEVRAWQKPHFKERVKAEYGVALEFLTSEQASHLLDVLNGNGHDAHADGRQS